MGNQASQPTPPSTLSPDSSPSVSRASSPLGSNPSPLPSPAHATAAQFPAAAQSAQSPASLLSSSAADQSMLQCPASFFLEEELTLSAFESTALPSQAQDVLPEDVTAVLLAANGPTTVDVTSLPASLLTTVENEPSSPQSPQSPVSPPVAAMASVSDSQQAGGGGAVGVSSSSAARVLDGPLSRLLVHSIGSVAHDPQIGGRLLSGLESQLSRYGCRLRTLHEAVVRETGRERERRSRKMDPGRGQLINRTPLPPVTSFSVRSASSLIVDLCLSHSAQLHDPQQVHALLNVLAGVLYEEGLLTLANGSLPLHADLSEGLQPIFDLLHSIVACSFPPLPNVPPVDHRAMDVLLSLSLARGSLLHLLDFLDLLRTRPELSVDSTLLCSLSRRYQLPVDRLFDAASKDERVSGVAAMAVLLSQLQALVSRICPLDASYLPLSSSSPLTDNANNAPLLYHPFCVQLTPAVLSHLSTLLIHFVSLPATERSPATDAALNAVLHLLTVHFYQLILSGTAASPSYQSCLSLYPHLLSMLYDCKEWSMSCATAQLIAFSFPFFFPSVSEQLHQLHQLLADWDDAQSNLGTPTVMRANFNFSQELDEAKSKEMADDSSRYSSAASSHRSSVLLSPSLAAHQMQSPSHSVQPSLSITATVGAMPGRFPSRDPAQLYLTRLLLLRYSCFSGALSLVDALLEYTPESSKDGSKQPAFNGAASVDRDSAAQLMRDVLSLIQYELKQRMRTEQSLTPQSQLPSSGGVTRCLSITCAGQQIAEVEVSLLLRVCLELLEAVQNQLLSRQAALYELQDRQEAERREKQQRQQQEDEEAVDEQQKAATAEDQLPLITQTAESKAKAAAEASTTPPFSRSGSLIAPLSFAPTDYYLYYVSSVLLSCSSVMSAAYDVHRFYAPTDVGSSPTVLSDGYEQLLSLLRRVAFPLVVVNCGFVSPSRPQLASATLAALTSFLEQLTRLNRIGGFLSQHDCPSSTDSNADDELTVNSVYESSHPYRPFTDQYVLLTLPPFPLLATATPLSVTLTFDPTLCGTNNKYDYVELFTLNSFYSTSLSRPDCFTLSHSMDKNTVPLHGDSLSRRFHGNRLHGSSTFPTAPLTFTNQHVVLHFHSGTSYRAAQPVIDSATHYGFSVRVDATYERQSSTAAGLRYLSTMYSPSWFSDLLQLSSYLSASLCACLIRGHPVGDSEYKVDQWLHTVVFSGGLDKDRDKDGHDDSNPFLPSLVTTTPSSLSSTQSLADREQRQRHAQFLTSLMTCDSTDTSAPESSASKLLQKLKKANVDRQVVQRSIARAAQGIAQCVFAVLLKQTNRVDDAIVCAERDDQRLDANIVKLYKKAVEIKLDVRAQYDLTQDTTALCAELQRKADFLLSLHSVHAQLEQIREQKETANAQAAAGRMGVDVLRRQSSFTSPPPSTAPPLLTHLSSPAVISESHARGVSVDIDELARRSARPTFDKRASVWNRQRVMGAMMQSTVRAMRMLKSLMKLRTKASSAADKEDPIDSVAGVVFEFMREKQPVARLLNTLQLALHQQRQRAEHRVLGLQAVRQLCTKILVLRGQHDPQSVAGGGGHTRLPSLPPSSYSVRQRDDPLRLCEVLLILVSRSLRATPGTITPPLPVSSVRSGRAAAGGASTFTYSPSMHILSSVDSVGLELKSFIFNEFFAFLSLFFELTRDEPTLKARPDEDEQSTLLSPTARLHLLHLCATDFEADLEEDDSSSASPFFTRSHDLLALSRLGIMSFLRPLAPFQLSSGASSSALLSLTRNTALSWAVSFSAWGMCRLLAYAATDAISAMSAAEDEDAGELHVSVLDFIIELLQYNSAAQDHRDDDQPSVHDKDRSTVVDKASSLVSFSGASVAFHMAAAQRMKLAQYGGFPKAAFDLSQSSFAPPASASAEPEEGELHEFNCQLLWAILRCCQSAATRRRLAQSMSLLPVLFRTLATSPTVSASATRRDQPLGAANLSQLLSIRILRHLLPLIHPTSTHMQHLTAHTQQLSGSLLSSFLSHITRACLAATRASVTQPFATSKHNPSVELQLANEYVFLLRTLLASTQWSDAINALLDKHLSQLRNIHYDDTDKLDINAADDASDEADIDNASFASNDFPVLGGSVSASISNMPPCLPLPVLGRVLACLWVIGGGPTILGEGVRVSVVLDGQFRTGTIIRTLPSSAKERRADSESAVADDCLYEVLVDEAEHLDDVVQDDSTQQTQHTESSSSSRDRRGKPGHSRSNTASSALPTQPTMGSPAFYAASFGPSTSSVYNKTVYTFYHSSLTALDAITVPLLSLSPAASSSIVYTIGTFLRRMEQDSGVKAASDSSTLVMRMDKRFSNMSVEDEKAVERKEAGGVVPPLFASAKEPVDEGKDKPRLSRSDSQPTEDEAVRKASVSLFWSDMKQRALKALNVVLLREDIATLVLQQGLGPLLVPLALTPLAQLHHVNKAAKAEQTSEVDPHEATISVTDLESRQLELAYLIVARATETYAVRTERKRLWQLEDEKKAAEAARKEEAKRAQEEKDRQDKLHRITHLLVNDPHHPAHPLLFHPRSPALQGASACDECRRQEATNIYWCAACDYSLCLRCIEPTLAVLRLQVEGEKGGADSQPLFPPSIYHPTHHHALHYSVSVYDGRFKCDICARDKGGPVYHCNACKYDICIACCVSTFMEEKQRILEDEQRLAEELAEVEARRLQAKEEEKTQHTDEAEADDTVAELNTVVVTSEKSAALAMELQLLGFPASRCLRAASTAKSLSAALSLLLDDIDSISPDLSSIPSGSTSTPPTWQMVSQAYWPPTMKLAEGMDKIRCFMDCYTERSSDLDSGSGAGIGSDLDLMAGHRAGAMEDRASVSAASDTTVVNRKKEERKKRRKGAASIDTTRSATDELSSAYFSCPHYQLHHAVDHDPAAHRREFGKWRATFESRVVYHAELLAVYKAAQHNQTALTVLYARRCLLSLLHLLKDQLRAESGTAVGGMSAASSPFGSRHASPLPSPKSSPHHRPSSSTHASPVLSIRSLGSRLSSPAGGIRALSSSPSPLSKPSTLAAPTLSPLHAAGSGRRGGAASSGHSLSSFGPAGFLAKFVALLCSAPHQLTIPQQASQLDVLSGGGGKAGLANLGDIVHTILLNEKHKLETETGRGAHIDQHTFSVHAPIARHLLQDAIAHMLTLCKRDTAVDRHALLNTVIYIMEAFFALEEARLQIRHRRLMSIYGGEATDSVSSSASASGSRANLMLGLVFNVPVCLLMLECIAQSSYHPSTSTELSAQQRDYLDAMDRQRLVFVRLVARVLALRTRYMDDYQAHHVLAPTFFYASAAHHVGHSLSLPSTGAWLPFHQNWYRVLHARLSSIPTSMMTVVESEVYAGRGAQQQPAYPHTFFCHALVDLALLYEKFRKRLFAFVPSLLTKWQRMEEEKDKQFEEDCKEAERELMATSLAANATPAAVIHSDSLLDRRPSVQASDGRSRINTLVINSNTAANGGARRGSLQSPSTNLLAPISPVHSPTTTSSSYSTNLFSSPATPTAFTSLITPNADGSTSSISLTDMGTDISPTSPLGLALSSLPSTPDISISFSLQQAEPSMESFAPLDQLAGRPQSVVLDLVGGGRGSLSAVDGTAIMLSEGEERRERDESLSDDEGAEGSSSFRGNSAERQLHSSEGLSAEDRQRRAERKLRKKERDSHVWFADVSLIELTLAALRVRTRDKSKAAKQGMHDQLADFSAGGGIDEGDEAMDDLDDEEEQPRLMRTKSIEEKAPMPIIATDAPSPAAAQAKNEEQKEQHQPTERSKDEKEQSSDDATVNVFSAVVSPPSSSASSSPSPVLTPTPSSDATSGAVTSLLNISLTSPASGSSLPAEFVDTFYERVQRDMFNLSKKKREDDILKKLKEEEDRLEAQHDDAATEAALASDWSCPTCTYNNLALTTRCDMCDTPSPLPPPPTSSTPLLYFEVTVLCLGEKSCLGIGLCQPGYPAHMLPGWRQGSWGFHADNGAVYRADQPGKEYAEKWAVGDVVGCGLRLTQRELFFTLNGRDLGVAFTDIPVADYYACIGTHSMKEAMTINFGQQPFMYSDLSSCFVPRPDLTLRSPAANVMAEIDTAMFRTMTSLADACSLVQSSGLLTSNGKVLPVHSHSCGYFEITIEKCTPQPRLAFGFAPGDYTITSLPGWDEHGYGLHCDDGYLYSTAVAGGRRPFAALGVQAGTVIGCGFDRRKKEIFFTLNGRILGVAVDRVEETNFHATLGMQTTGDVCAVNFGQQPFVYAAIQPFLLSTADNSLSRHHERLVVESELKVTREGEDEEAGIVQSQRPILPKSQLQLQLENEESQHTLQPKPRSYFTDTIERLFGVEEDEALVALINRRCEKDEAAINVVDKPAAFTLTPEERVQFTCLSAPAIATFDLQVRLALLSKLNQFMSFAVYFTNLSRPGRRSILARHFRDVHIRALFFYPLKYFLFRQSLNNTSFQPEHSQQRPPFMLKLDLFKSQKLAQKKRLDATADRSLFGQAFQQLYLHHHDEADKYGDHDTDPTRFFVAPDSQQRPWKVVFKGLFADDYGGLYRDSLDRMCRELQSTVLSLFIPTPNAREQIGSNRHHFVPNPAARSPVELSMFRFVGRLMGLAMRTGELLYLDLPSIVWKPMVDEAVSEDDVMAIDRLSFSMVTELRKLEQHIQRDKGKGGVTPELFSDYIDCSFVVVGSDGAIHELVPGGTNIPVSWQNRHAFIDALIAYRKQEFRLQCAALRDGLSSVVPAAQLTMFTWEQLRSQICGQPTIDVAMLQQMSQYEGCQSTDPHILFFWQVMNQRFSEQQKSSFLQFVNGSSRLPARAADFEKRFRLQRFYPSTGKADDYLPVAHTWSANHHRHMHVTRLHSAATGSYSSCTARPTHASPPCCVCCDCSVCAQLLLVGVAVLLDGGGRIPAAAVRHHALCGHRRGLHRGSESEWQADWCGGQRRGRLSGAARQIRIGQTAPAVCMWSLDTCAVQHTALSMTAAQQRTSGRSGDASAVSFAKDSERA